MNKPTRTQLRVLKALQNQTATAARERPSTAPAEATDTVHRLAESSVELAAAAIAGGVPVEWVEQAQARGSKGISWNPNLYLRRAAPVDRAALLSRLQVDQTWLARACGIHAAYQHLAPIGESETGARTERILETLWERSSQVTALLEVHPGEATAWRGEQWLATAEAAATGLAPAELERQWHEIAGTDIDGYATQSIALTGVGIQPDPTLSPPRPVQVFEALAQRRDHHLQVAFSDRPGHQIDAAVTATGSPASDLEHEPPPQPPEFSHSPELHVPGVEP